MREVFVGFDSAWGNKIPGGIVWAMFVDGRVDRVSEPQPASFDEAAAVINDLRSNSDYVLIALDQPTIVPNESGSRPVDRVAGSLLSRIGGAAQPANRSKSKLFGAEAPVWNFLKRIKARENPPAAREEAQGVYLIEVFPALALPTLAPSIWARRAAAKYNPGKPNFRLSDWKLVSDAVRHHSHALGLESLSVWANRLASSASPEKLDQDCMDAAICLVVALQWRRQPRTRMAIIGDGQNGYMVTPVTPEIRERILEPAATKQNVTIDAPWPEDANSARFEEEAPGRGESTLRQSDWRQDARFEHALRSLVARCPESGRPSQPGKVFSGWASRLKASASVNRLISDNSADQAYGETVVVEVWYNPTAAYMAAALCRARGIGKVKRIDDLFGELQAFGRDPEPLSAFREALAGRSDRDATPARAEVPLSASYLEFQKRRLKKQVASSEKGELGGTGCAVLCGLFVAVALFLLVASLY